MVATPHYISPQDYLALERQNPIRHEYRHGLVYAMAGGSDSHARITINLLSLINLHLGDSPCRLYNGDVKVNYRDDFYYYPDAFVTCDLRDRKDRYIKRHPKLIVEVLSSGTQAFDCGDKFQDFQQIETLEEYILISQDSPRVECRRRVDRDRWETTFYGAGDRVALISLGMDFPIATLYRGADL